MTREEREQRLLELASAITMHKQGYDMHNELENRIRSIYTVGDPKAREAKEYLAEYVRGIALKCDQRMRDVVIQAAAEIEGEFEELELQHRDDMTRHEADEL